MPPKRKKSSGAAAPPKKKKPAAKKPAANKTPQPPEEQDPTPLFNACENGQVDAARLLLDKGATVDRVTDWGTPLSIAKQQGHSAVVALLEEKKKAARSRRSRRDGLHVSI